MLFPRFISLATRTLLLLFPIAIAVLMGWSTPAMAHPLLAALPPGNPVKDPQALLRLALPIDNASVRDLQLSLEDIENEARSRRWTGVKGDISKAIATLSRHQEDILASVIPAKQTQSSELLTQVATDLQTLKTAADEKNGPVIRKLRAKVLNNIGIVEAGMVAEFPFEIPAQYQSYPLLKGRATVELKTTKGPVILTLDGYNAPITAGNFVDLVQRKFYDGLPFNRAEESYVLQTGDPAGDAIGFISPKTKATRTIPLEIRVKEDNDPIYGITLEDAGRYLETPRLPFSSYGAVAMAYGDDPNDASSQFFFHLFVSDLTPAGSNLLDGRYALFGYTTAGTDVLSELKEGDKIISARVTSGLENFVKGKDR
jgi:peptidylprolyl isomerase